MTIYLVVDVIHEHVVGSAISLGLAELMASQYEGEHEGEYDGHCIIKKIEINSN